MKTQQPEAFDLAKGRIDFLKFPEQQLGWTTINGVEISPFNGQWIAHYTPGRAASLLSIQSETHRINLGDIVNDLADAGILTNPNRDACAGSILKANPTMFVGNNELQYVYDSNSFSAINIILPLECRAADAVLPAATATPDVVRMTQAAVVADQNQATAEAAAIVSTPSYQEVVPQKTGDTTVLDAVLCFGIPTAAVLVGGMLYRYVKNVLNVKPQHNPIVTPSMPTGQWIEQPAPKKSAKAPKPKIVEHADVPLSEAQQRILSALDPVSPEERAEIVTNVVHRMAQGLDEMSPQEAHTVLIQRIQDFERDARQSILEKALRPTTYPTPTNPGKPWDSGLPDGLEQLKALRPKPPAPNGPALPPPPKKS